MKKQIRLLSTLLVVVSCIAVTDAQVAANSPYTLEQSVIASGGAQSTGGTFTVDGTIGQSIAGTRSTNSPFDITGGFWTAPQLAVTAANVIVGGRITTSNGRGIRNVLVTMIGMGGESRTVLSSAFGYYRFDNVEAGETVTISVKARRFKFSQSSIVRTTNESIADADFISEQ